jgi:hypothetical protein
MLGHHNATSSNDGDTSDLMVVNTTNIDGAESALSDTYVITSNAAIGAAINKGPGSLSAVCRTDSVKTCHINCLVACTINRNLITSARVHLGVLTSAVIGENLPNVRRR